MSNKYLSLSLSLRTRSLRRDRFLSRYLDIDNLFHTYMDHDASW